MSCVDDLDLLIKDRIRSIQSGGLRSYRPSLDYRKVERSVDTISNLILNMVEPLRMEHLEIEYYCMDCGQYHKVLADCGDHVNCGLCAGRYGLNKINRAIHHVKRFNGLDGKELVFTIPAKYYYLFDANKRNQKKWRRLIVRILRKVFKGYKIAHVVKYQSFSSEDPTKFRPHIHIWLSKRMIDVRPYFKTKAGPRYNMNYKKVILRSARMDYDWVREMYMKGMNNIFGITGILNFYCDNNERLRSPIDKIAYILRPPLNLKLVKLSGKVQYFGKKGFKQYNYLDFYTKVQKNNKDNLYIGYGGYYSCNTYSKYLDLFSAVAGWPKKKVLCSVCGHEMKLISRFRVCKHYKVAVMNGYVPQVLKDRWKQSVL